MIKIGFIDTFGTAREFFTRVLSSRWEVEVVDPAEAFFLFFGDENFGTDNVRYDAPCRIFYTGENRRPVDYDHDYAVSFDTINSPRHYRLPLYVLEYYKYKKMGIYNRGWRDIMRSTYPRVDVEREWQFKEGLFSYVQSNPNAVFRTQFMHALLKEPYQVRCGGRHLNNTGSELRRDDWRSKLEFIQDSAFNVAIENGIHPGYVTEKPLESFISWTIPVCFGDSMAHQEFNPEALVDIRDFRHGSQIDVGELAKYCDSIFADKNKYCDMLEKRPVLHNEHLDLDRFLDWFEMFPLRELTGG